MGEITPETIDTGTLVVDIMTQMEKNDLAWNFPGHVVDKEFKKRKRDEQSHRKNVQTFSVIALGGVKQMFSPRTALPHEAQPEKALAPVQNRREHIGPLRCGG